MDVKVGDVVHVRATVVEPTFHNGDVALSIAGACLSCFAWCRPDQIVHVDPRPLQVGDKVRSWHGNVCEIVAIHENSAWVSVTPGHHETWPLSQLSRVA